jgi:hypothetical protein
MKKPLNHHYLQRRHWMPRTGEKLTLYINRHYDHQVTLNQKYLDELDVFGSITVKELINGVLRRSPQKVSRAPRAIKREITKFQKYPEHYLLIDPDFSQIYWKDIRNWFDRDVGCGAMAYRLVLRLKKRYPSAAKQSFINGLRLIHPTAFFHKAMVIASDVTSLEPLIQVANADGLCIEVKID